jgi:hypothetical protein
MAPQHRKGPRFYRPKFRPLVDAEWEAVWSHVKLASGNAPLADEARVRKWVDYSAQLSGCFAGHSVIGFDKQMFSRLAKEARKFLRETKSYILSATKFFGDPDDGSAESSDPWPERKILTNLRELQLLLIHRIETLERSGKEVESSPGNAAKEDRDRWMARLTMVWSGPCRLSSKNSKHLRGFLVDALVPYQHQDVSHRGAEHFVARWNAGKIPRPQNRFGLFNF